MAQENFSEQTTEAILKNKKTTSFVTGLLAGMLSVLLVLAIYQTVTDTATGTSLVAVALCLSPILILNYSRLKAMNAELKSRGLK